EADAVAPRLELDPYGEALAALAVVVEDRLAAVAAVGELGQLRAQPALGVLDRSGHAPAHQIEAVVVDQREQALPPDARRREHRVEVTAEALGIAAVENQRVHRVAPRLAVDDDLERREPRALRPELDRARV